MADQTAQAEQNVGALTDQARKASAYNAFAAAHGPVAAYGLINPEAAQESQNYLLRGQTDPIAVQQAAATLAGTQAQTGLAQAGAAKDTAVTSSLNFTNTKQQQLTDLGLLAANAGSDGSIDQNQVLAYLRKHGSDINVDPDQYGAIAVRLAQPHQLDKNGQPVPGTSGLDALNNYRQGLTGASKATGNMQIIRGPDGNPIVLQNSGLGVKETELPAGSTTAPLLQAQTAQKREGVYAADDPIKAAAAMLTAKNPTQTIVGADGQTYTLTRQSGAVGVQPHATGINSITGPQGAGNKAAAVKVGQATGTNEANMLPQNVAIARADLGQMDLQYGRTFDALSKASSLVTPFSTGFGAETVGRLPASQTKALEAQIQTAKSNIALVTANMSRQGGKSSAVPVRNMQEFKAYQDALGAINVNAAPTVVRDQIATAKRSLQDLQAAVHSMYQAKYGAGLTGGQPATAGAAGGWSIQRVQ